MELKDRVVLVTGSSSGIGQAIAIECAKAGAHVLIHYRKNKKGAEEIFEIYITPDLPIHTKYLDPKHQQFNEQYKHFNGDVNFRNILDSSGKVEKNQLNG